MSSVRGWDVIGGVLCNVLWVVCCVLCVGCAVCQLGLVNPLPPGGPAPSTYVVCQHLGTFGIPSLSVSAPIRVRTSLGRACVTLPTTFQQCFPANTPTTLFVMPVLGVVGATELTSSHVHVTIYRDHKGR